MRDFVPLAETLALKPFEPAPGLASRLAAMNAAGNAREFCWDQLLDFGLIAAGDASELSRFSIFSGASYDELLKWTPTRRSTSVFSINGQIVTSFRLRRRRLRLCPDCVDADLADAPGLRGDAAVACRVFTLIDAVRTCPVHCRSLVQVADETTFAYHQQDYSIAIGEALEDLDRVRAQSVARDPTAFELYILSRLGVLAGPPAPLLDGMDISQATVLCERMGVFDLHGRAAQILDHDEDGMRACAQRGFEWCARGADGIRDFVSMAHDRAVRDRTTGMSNAIFGRFHYFLNSEANRSNFVGIKQIIVDRLSELLPYGPDDAPVFGVLPSRRHWHTLVSAERQYGIAYRSIKKRVERAGIHTRLNLTFDKTRFAIGVDELDDLLLSPEGTISRAEAIERTGAHAHDFAALEAAGLLHPVSGDASAANARYRRGDVDQMEKALLGRAVSLIEEQPNWVSIHRAYLATSWSRGEVFGHVASGSVPAGSVDGLQSIASLRVDLSALRRLHPLFGREVMSMDEAATLLEISETVVNRLVKRKWIGAHEQRNESTGKLRMTLLKDDVLAFARTYIPVSEVWRRRGGSMPKIIPLLRAHGLEPAFPPALIRCTFYSRDEVDRIVPPHAQVDPPP